MTSFDRLKSDRELVAECIAFHAWGCDFTCTEHGEGAIRAADAVLAALGDRLLPEIPEGFDYVKVRLTNTSNERMLIGYGPTPAAAIRAALEDQP